MFKRTISAILIIILVFGIAGCKKKKTTVTNGNINFNELANTVSDSSELPTWEGKQLKLKVWYAMGQGGRQQYKPTDDVVSKEIARVTGITIDEESFENAEGLADAELGKIVASGEWPDIVLNCPANIVQTIVDSGVAYDLSEYFPSYCTNLVDVYKKIPQLNEALVSKRDDGKMYDFYYSPYVGAMKYIYPDIPKDKINLVSPITEPYPYVYVRDDILKKIYPEAKTRAELEEIYRKNGKFTKEEITDVTFSSKEEFFDFLYKVKELDVKVGNKSVEPFYNVSVADNWNLLVNLGGLFGYSYDGNVGANYFTYWDKETKKVEYMFKQPEFKEILWDLTKLVMDGVSSKEALIDTRSDFTQKVANGLYAVLYGWDAPNGIFVPDGKDFDYRKVYLTIPQKTDKYLFAESQLLGDTALITNKNLGEDDLEQVLKFFDFMASEAGQKLTYWGPKTAGLYEEAEDGTLRYTDKELEQRMVYDVMNDREKYYNLASNAWPNYPIFSASKYNPKIMYSFDTKDVSKLDVAFALNNYETPELTASTVPNVWLFDSYGIEGINDLWKSRTTFETNIFKIFASADKNEFEKRYNEMVASAERMGATDETLAECNAKFEEVNADYMKNIK